MWFMIITCSYLGADGHVVVVQVVDRGHVLITKDKDKLRMVCHRVQMFLFVVRRFWGAGNRVSWYVCVLVFR